MTALFRSVAYAARSSWHLGAVDHELVLTAELSKALKQF